MLIGALLSPYAAALNWPTNEMRERGQAIQLLFGAVVAALSGTGVALAESNANISSVVGTAIAAALLPPTVNSGICFSYVIIGQYFVVRPQHRHRCLASVLVPLITPQSSHHWSRSLARRTT